MNNPVIDFYDTLSPFYRENMGWDWIDGMKQEGSVLSAFLKKRCENDGPFKLLDCSCGIGTQAIGLALQGHIVHAADLSPNSIECAKTEAEKCGAKNMSFSVANFFDLEKTVKDTFDIVLSCDNSMAHCINEGDPQRAFTSIHSRLNRGGLVLISIRDYAPLIKERPKMTSQHVQDKKEGRRIAFQVWDWDENGKRYKNHQFLIQEIDGEFKTNHFETTLRALVKEDVINAMEKSGFHDIQWHTPNESSYYQPIITAYKK